MTGTGEIDLGHEIVFRWGHAGTRTFDVALDVAAVTVVESTVHAGGDGARADVDDGVVRAHVEIDVDAFAGELTLTATLEIHDPLEPSSPWKTILDVEHHVLLRFDPSKGEVDGSPAAHPPAVAGTYGPTGPSGSSGVTRFHVRDQRRELLDIGQLVKAEMWSGYPPFTFNTVACVGRPTAGPDAPGPYADPDSPWFNIFFGIYQLDCAKTDGWTRPFGYQSADGVDSVLHGEDMARLGKSDWNWFSNYLYGVPRDVCEQYSGIDMGRIDFSPTTVEAIGTTQWHHWTMSGVTVASVYESDAPAAAKLVENSILTPEWQKGFGLPCPRPDHTTSFVPTTLEAEAVMAYAEDAEGFHTLVFGGTAAVGGDPAFLAAQMEACRAVVTADYPDAGFAAG